MKEWFDPSAKLAFWWTLRLGGPIPSGMDESVGRQALHAPRVSGRPPQTYKNTINAPNVGSTRDLISLKNVYKGNIDCKADTTGKTFRDTNMTRMSRLALSSHIYFLLFETPIATLWSSCAPKHAMWQPVFRSASEFKVRNLI